MSDIFLSYVVQDTDIAEQIAHSLAVVGYETWHYTRDSLPGISYLLQTGQAIETAQAVVLVISSYAVMSSQVTREVERAHECGKPFIPVLHDMTHIEFQTRQQAWRQAVGTAVSIPIPTEGVVAIMPRILAALQALGIQPGRAEQTEGLAGKTAAGPSHIRVSPPHVSVSATVKTWVAMAGVIMVSAWALWLFLYSVAPLGPDETIIVVVLCAAMILGGKWGWSRLRKRRSAK